MADARVEIEPKNQSHHFSEFSDEVPPEINERLEALEASMTNATEIALATLGNVDAGKSTLTACLTDRILDDGTARNRVAVHNHEVDSGRTSAVANRVIEYTQNHVNAFLEGRIHEEPMGGKKGKGLREQTDARKIVSLHDLCGHEKYFGTTSHGVSSMYPDAGLLAVNPGRGVLQMTKEHYTLAVSLNVPVLIIITKADISIRNSCIETEEQIVKMCKKFRRTPKFLNSIDDYEIYKEGEKIFLNLREKFYEGDDPYGFEERAKALRLKVQTMRDERDPFLVEIKTEMYSHVAPNDGDTNDNPNEPHPHETQISEFKDRYGLSEDTYQHLFTYINYNATKMHLVSEIVANLNAAASGEYNQTIGKQSIVPVIYMSNFNGWNLDTIRDSIMFLKPRDIWNKEANAIIKVLGKNIGRPNLGDVNINGSVFYIDRAYNVVGAGLVISGINRGQTIRVGDEVMVGPINKTFVKIKIKSIHNDNRQFVDSLDDHHRGCLNITTTSKVKLSKSDVKKGMVLISDNQMTQHVAYHFKAVITVLKNESKSTTLRVGACPLLDAGTIKQTARLIAILDQSNGAEATTSEQGDGAEATTSEQVEASRELSFRSRSERKKTQEIVKPGQVREVLLKFTRKPEFIPEGEQFIFRSGTVHGIGVVSEPVPIATDPEAVADPVKKKHRRVRASHKPATPVATVIKVE